MSVWRAQREVSSREFAEWMAYATLEPFGPEREDQRAGVVAATLANINRDSKLRPEPYSVEDFFPRHDTPVIPAEDLGPTPDQLESKLRNWAKMMTHQHEKSQKKVKTTKE